MLYIEVWDIVINEATNYDVMPLCFSHKSFVIWVTWIMIRNSRDKPFLMSVFFSRPSDCTLQGVLPFTYEQC